MWTAQQVADHALRAAVQRIRLHVVHQALQPPRQTGQHVQRELRVALDLAHHRRTLDGEQQGVGQRLRRHQIGRTHEHHRLAKAAPRSAQVNHLFDPCGRHGEQLDLSHDHDVKFAAGVAHVKDHASALEPAHMAVLGQAGALGLGDAGKQRQSAQVALKIEAVVRHGREPELAGSQQCRADGIGPLSFTPPSCRLRPGRSRSRADR